MGTEDETERLPENEVIPTEEGFDVENTGETGGSDEQVGDTAHAARAGSGWGTTAAALVIALLALGTGLGIGYLLWGEAIHVSGVMPVVQAQPLDPISAQTGPAVAHQQMQHEAKPTQGPALPPAQYVAKLPEAYTLPVSYGQLGPQLIKGGAIDLPTFLAIYANGGKPLPEAEQAILTEGSDDKVVIDGSNAHFLLNFFWAVGLANRNDILLKGAIQENGADQVGNYASTGGWTLAAKPVMQVFASLPLLKLTPEQQARLQKVAEATYRPCCGNSTAFPDCNHGMAMLGVLELMAAHDATEAQMFEAAEYISAFWFPQEMVQAAAYFKLTKGQDFAALDPKRMVSREIFSTTGAQSGQKWLADGGRLGKPAQSGGACGV
ncbi:MAG: hypothetical protein U0X20_20230 [Caldilineaceae bacterium]